MRGRTWIDPGFPLGRFIVSPLTADSIATIGLYLLSENVGRLEGAWLAPADRDWLERATRASFQACQVHPWDLYSFEAHNQARALYALDCARDAIRKQAGLREEEAPHRWQANAFSMVAKGAHQQQRTAASGRSPRNVIAGPWPDHLRPRSSHGRGPRGGK